MSKQILLVMAHQDDEAAFSTRVAREIDHGNRVTCVYLTDGSGNGVNPQVRDRESLRVLQALGVSSDCIHFIGSQHKIPDGDLADNLERAYELLELTLTNIKFNRIYCMAYEGGHQDHDACHIATLAFSAQRKLLSRTWQMPFYNGRGTSNKFFRVLLPLPTPAYTYTRRLSLSEAVTHTLHILRYKSQWKTWLGLLPELLYQRILRRRETVQTVSLKTISERPHKGALLYERLFGYSYLKFRSAADHFLQNHTLTTPTGQHPKQD